MESESTSNNRAFLSQRTVFDGGVEPAILIVEGGKIKEIVHGAGENEIQSVLKNYPGIQLENCGSCFLMPGIVDSHVHVNEPGRTEWEGFCTATKAAAAGGVTTIADMPLNSIPPTTTVENLKTKAKAAYGNVYVDVAFWGGVIPGNEKELRPLVDAGVVGFKCFLCPSGVDEFPNVNANDVQKALAELKSTKSFLAFHAEYLHENEMPDTEGDPEMYDTYLRSRPSSMEMSAIQMVCEWCKTSKVRCHIVHLSTAEALDVIKDAKESGAPLTVETCYHYLVLSAEDVPKCATQFKCSPPIRSKANQEKLWKALQSGLLDMVVSDHSPCVKELKCCDFLTAWGGISSLQFGLSLLWSKARNEDGTNCLEVSKLSKLLSAYPAKLCGLDDRKGSLSVGMDADFVVWDPDKGFKIQKDQILYKNKITPYENKTLYGKVMATILGGQYIYKDGQLCDKPIGNLLLNESILS